MTEKLRALVVDDEPDIRELIGITLSRMDVDCIEAENVTQAKSILDDEEALALCLTDMRLPDGDGIELVGYMQKNFPQIPVAVITAYGNMELAITALKAGAFDFVSKPVDLQMLRDLVETALKLSTPSIVMKDGGMSRLLGKSAVSQELRLMIKKLARSQAPVLISGDSGTGKELVARLIHENGPRGDKPFIPVNCGAIPAELMESEFFGHKKGSFTGAVENKKGLFKAAHRGTIFLDEIGDLPIHMQVKLLRVIQERAVRSIGEEKETPIDVRILSATHLNLQELVSVGSFRQDLFYRVNVIELHVPKLSERKEDIEIFVNHFLSKLANQLNIQAPTLTDEAMDALQQYRFPGNVRELENILEGAATLCENNKVKKEDLQLRLDLGEDERDDMAHMPLEPYLDSVEKRAIEAALEANQWNKTETAKQLGITLRALRYRLKKLGLE